MNKLIVLLTSPGAIKAAGYGILAGLGTSLDGVIDIDIPAVHGAVEHGLIGLAVALLVYAKTE